MDIGITRIIKISLAEHIKAYLTALGWTNVANWLHLKSVPSTTSPPNIGIYYVGDIGKHFEMGNRKLEFQYRFYIDIKAVNEPQLDDLMRQIEESLTSFRVVDMNVKMPGDDGYDPVAQHLAMADCIDVNGKILSDTEYVGRVTTLIIPDKPL